MEELRWFCACVFPSILLRATHALKAVAQTAFTNLRKGDRLAGLGRPERFQVTPGISTLPADLEALFHQHPPVSPKAVSHRRAKTDASSSASPPDSPHTTPNPALVPLAAQPQRGTEEPAYEEG